MGRFGRGKLTHGVGPGAGVVVGHRGGRGQRGDQRVGVDHRRGPRPPQLAGRAIALSIAVVVAQGPQGVAAGGAQAQRTQRLDERWRLFDRLVVMGRGDGVFEFSQRAHGVVLGRFAVGRAQPPQGRVGVGQAAAVNQGRDPPRVQRCAGGVSFGYGVGQVVQAGERGVGFEGLL